MTIRISFSDKTVRVAVEINGAIESAITELPQRTWVSLTDEERFEIRMHSIQNMDENFQETLCKAIEAKLRSKNENR
jgi:hypothetical protein